MIYLLATNNPNKAREIRAMFETAGLKLITLADLGLYFEAREDGQTFADNAMQKATETAAFLRDIGAGSVHTGCMGKQSGCLPWQLSEEAARVPKGTASPCGHTGEQSSPLQKDFPYREFLSPYSIAVLADDSGLVIDALDGEPGVDSALYMGRDTPYAEKCQNILSRLANVPDGKRIARFVCALVCILPDGSQLTAEGISEGFISRNIRGQGGFGYDPIFFYPPYNKTLAELTQEEKNQISHRGQAIHKMIGLILEIDTNSRNK